MSKSLFGHRNDKITVNHVYGMPAFGQSTFYTGKEVAKLVRPLLNPADSIATQQANVQTALNEIAVIEGTK